VWGLWISLLIAGRSAPRTRCALAAPVNPRAERGSIYPGDTAMRTADAVTIQIHTVRLTREKSG
jgi:hypothetical protein